MLDLVALTKITVKKSTAACIGLATAAAIAGAAPSAMADAVPGSGTGSIIAAVSTNNVSVQSTAPRFVSGYSFHCSQEMEADNVTGPEVDSVVENYYFSAEYDEELETWRYPGPTVTVVLNNNGLCVTVFR